MTIEHYYHVYADGEGDWLNAIEEHCDALSVISKPFNVYGTIIGTDANIKLARATLTDRLSKMADSIFFQEAASGWEQPTLEQMHSMSHQHDNPILYCHTKGSANPSPFSISWRQSMTKHLIYRWDECLEKLNEVDAVGCHWLTKVEYPEFIEIPIFGGNFWWATAKYVRQLPPLDYDSRHDAEAWLGRGNPSTYDLLRGWPALEVFERGRSLVSCE